ncbi:unnamed protein product, partial [Vitis vinifera]
MDFVLYPIHPSQQPSYHHNQWWWLCHRGHLCDQCDHLFYICRCTKTWKKIVLWFVIGMIFIGILATITMLFFHGTLKRSLFIGLFCVAFNITMYTAPPTIMILIGINMESLKKVKAINLKANFLSPN